PVPDLQRILETLWSRRPQPPLDLPRSLRAALEKALPTLGPGSGVCPARPAAPTNPEDEFLHELLPDKIVFLRPGALSPKTVPLFTAALRDASQIAARGIILDLRHNRSESPFALAAELASFLTPPGTLLFQAKNAASGKSSPVQGASPRMLLAPLVVLLDSSTTGCAEVLAACLRVHAGAFLIGSTTAGQAAEYSFLPLSENRFFRFPTAEAVFETLPALFPNGLSPDLPVPVSEETAETLRAWSQKLRKVSPLISAPSYSRFNEAALIAGTNPDTERWIADQLARKLPPAPPAEKPPQDKVLCRALDFLTARQALLTPQNHAPASATP
ncbi:MAG: hypothetical protein RLZZ244_1381, partial [Verrucomicrobiota bacterium]